MLLNPQPAPKSWGDRLICSTFKMLIFAALVAAIGILVFQGVCMDMPELRKEMGL